MSRAVSKAVGKEIQELDEIEIREWLDSLDYVIGRRGPERARELLAQLGVHAQRAGVKIPFTANTPYINTIPVERQPVYPGSREIERRIKSLARWNALAMVVRANREESGIGGHISTYASAATLFEVGFNHFFRARNARHDGDIVYFQGHASPGVYARAFLEGRVSEEHLRNFRRELRQGGGLSSYPHPWLMPDFWEFPTVSMGLSPIMAIYQARFNRYLEDRGLKEPNDAKVWAFLGDGETDEPESLGAITLASRERLDNLIFVINCNLQRLDGPVRGNGNIIQELEAAFRGAGWNAIKVIWGSDWDPLLAQDRGGLLVKRMGEIVDGQWQKYATESGAYFREHFFGADPRLLEMVKHLSDEQLKKLRLGGHDPQKVYAAYRAAVEHRGTPTVILARTIKGYGLGESGEGRNITHQQKKLNEDELRQFRARFGIPISDDEIAETPFYRPPENSKEIQYLQEQRQKLGGYVPSRVVSVESIQAPEENLFAEFYEGTRGREASTTMVFVRLLAKLLRDDRLGKLIVPIVPDEARTFGMESLFRQVGIYSHAGQLYEPVDAATLLYYKEAKNGQILEEGITEAGSMSSFIAAGTAYATHGVNTIPFFIFYSMFGLQRVGDLVWAAGDSRCHGFMLGGTAGRTTLLGEGLQHQDGNSQLLAYPVPNLVAYDPAFAFELAVIIRDGILRMYEKQEDVFYYLTLMNENYAHPPMPDGEKIKEGILKGIYRFKAAEDERSELRAHLFGSGAILNEALKAQDLLAAEYGVAAGVWSVTSYKELYRDGAEVERWNMLHPAEKPRTPYITECVAGDDGVFVAATDFVKALPDSISRWLPGGPGGLISLGTDGFGRSDSRAALRDFFEVDYRFISLATLVALCRERKIKIEVVKQAMRDLEIDPEKANPRLA
ncbi:MAG TPA: pyruvate dehydrogenase (acetyl-transferring), homodimeric type [Blastocatellia bacterium]|jgi:pyruvate dehydrogenase E1 component|nr:pyruvate dehydrogenase (acetyl-transferring), homodimeric type [Blastocatellia bacterium]